jgi:biotin transport system substrate-specific component
MKAKRLVRIALFLVLTVIGGFIKIPFGAVSFTMQTVFVVSSGIFLGAIDGAIVQLSYLIMGLIGIPVFVNGGGIFYFMQISFGYLLAFPLSACISGYAISKLKTLKIVKIWLVSVLSLLPVYIVGIAYQIIILVVVVGVEFSSSLLTLIPLGAYFVFDCILCLIIAIIYPRVKNLTTNYARTN